MVDTAVRDHQVPGGRRRLLVWAPDLKTIGRDERRRDGRSRSTTPRPTRRCARSALPTGTWLAGHVDVRRRHRARAADPGASRRPRRLVRISPATIRSPCGARATRRRGRRSEVSTHRATVARCGSAAPCPPTTGRSCSRTRRAPARACSPTLHDGTQLALQGEHSAQILGGAFSPDGSLVATSGDDGATRAVGRQDRAPSSTRSWATTAGCWRAGLLERRRPADAAHGRASTAR